MRYLAIISHWFGALIFFIAAPGQAEEGSGAWATAPQAPWYFAVRVVDVDGAVDWYRTALGLREVDGSDADDGSWRFVNLANEHLAVEIVRDNRAQDAGRPLGLFKVGSAVPDVRHIADRVEKATGERPNVVSFEPYGIYILQLSDPEGNVLQLSSPLP